MNTIGINLTMTDKHHIPTEKVPIVTLKSTFPFTLHPQETPRNTVPIHRNSLQVPEQDSEDHRAR
jgi:hypothetical protein